MRYTVKQYNKLTQESFLLDIYLKYLSATFICFQVLQLLSQLRKEFNVSRDEKVLPLLERFHHGHRLVLQLLEESLKGVAKPKVPTITRTSASCLESGDVSEEGSDVFDTVTQLDDETGNTVAGEPLSKGKKATPKIGENPDRERPWSRSSFKT